MIAICCISPLLLTPLYLRRAFAPLMLCRFFAGNMEKDPARTIKKGNHTPCALHPLFCYAFHVSMLSFLFRFFSRKYGKLFAKYHKVGKTPPSPSFVHERMEKRPPPSLDVMCHVFCPQMMFLWLP